MRYYTGANAVWEKSPDNPVSEADYAIDRLLKARLLDARPDYGWLSEETADAPERLVRRRLWVVDPIDGTRDFIRGRGGWAISVARIDDGVPTLAALAAPAREEDWEAVQGAGARRNGIVARVSDCQTTGGCRIPIDPANLKASFWPTPWDAVATEKPNGLALRIAKVAAGDADTFFEGRPSRELDIAAAALLLTEAGGVISDRTGAPLRFNKPQPLFAGVVASTPAIHAEVLDRVDAGIVALRAARRAAGQPDPLRR